MKFIKKIRVGNLLSRVDSKSKHFKLSSLEDKQKEINEDDIICNVKSPKKLKRPKNVYSVKEFIKIEKLLNE